MDVQSLEAALTELQERYKAWHAPIVEFETSANQRVNRTDYSWKDRERDVEAFYKQQLQVYNPHQAEFPVREALLAAYPNMTAEERTRIRTFIGKNYHLLHILLYYILDCAECIESPEDSWILRSGLIAASIENYAWDFRDTHYVLSELAIAAREAGIDIEPHARAVAELCSPTIDHYYSMKSLIEEFHVYALTAKHVMGE